MDKLTVNIVSSNKNKLTIKESKNIIILFDFTVRSKCQD